MPVGAPFAVSHAQNGSVADLPVGLVNGSWSGVHELALFPDDNENYRVPTAAPASVRVRFCCKISASATVGICPTGAGSQVPGGIYEYRGTPASGPESAVRPARRRNISVRCHGQRSFPGVGERVSWRSWLQQPS
jgi:hypothetical protein